MSKWFFGETIFEIWKHQCLYFMFSLLRFIWWTFDVIIDISVFDVVKGLCYSHPQKCEKSLSITFHFSLKKSSSKIKPPLMLLGFSNEFFESYESSWICDVSCDVSCEMVFRLLIIASLIWWFWDLKIFSYIFSSWELIFKILSELWSQALSSVWSWV